MFELEGRGIGDGNISINNCDGSKGSVFVDKNVTIIFTKCGTEKTSVPKSVTYRIVEDHFVKI